MSVKLLVLKKLSRVTFENFSRLIFFFKGETLAKSSRPSSRGIFCEKFFTGHYSFHGCFFPIFQGSEFKFSREKKNDETMWDTGSLDRLVLLQWNCGCFTGIKLAMWTEDLRFLIDHQKHNIVLSYQITFKKTHGHSSFNTQDKKPLIDCIFNFHLHPPV